MIYTLAAQVSAIVPYAVTGKASTEIQVEYNGRTASRVTVPVVQSAPAIYTVGSTGVGQAAYYIRTTA